MIEKNGGNTISTLNNINGIRKSLQKIFQKAGGVESWIRDEKKRQDDLINSTQINYFLVISAEKRN